MNERENRLFVIQQLIIEGYSKYELTKMLTNGELFDKKFPATTAHDLIRDARQLCKIEPEESEILQARLLAIYKGSMKKEDYGSAIKAVKELKDFGTTTDKEVTIKFVKE